jgi:hypothetical protein
MQRVLRIFILSFFMGLKTFAFALDNTQREVWVNEAIIATYTYNAENFLSRQKEIARYFTTEGWIAYSKVLKASKIPEAVKKNNYSVSAVATLPPNITSLGQNQWKAVMPILVLYKNPEYQQKQNLEVTIHFQTASKDQGVRGLAISGLQAKAISAPCQCNSGANSPPP